VLPGDGDGETPWLYTTWHGGNNNADSDVRGRILAVNPSTAAFAHKARVRRLPGGEVEGQWWDDTRKPAQWRRFVASNGAIPRALLERVEAEASRAAGGGQ
jgi:hypothetical protein